MNLDNNIWSTLEGAYKIPYDVSLPLKRLQLTNDNSEINQLFDELWENLHHQGDVGIASYMAIPQLVTIYIDRLSLDWNYLSLCVTIEHCRLNIKNPDLPEEFKNYYFNGLKRLEEYLLMNFKKIKDPITLRLALSVFASLNGQAELAKAIEKMDDKEVIQEYLKNY